jgi:hypothetical protein
MRWSISCRPMRTAGRDGVDLLAHERYLDRAVPVAAEARQVCQHPLA